MQRGHLRDQCPRQPTSRIWLPGECNHGESSGVYGQRNLIDVTTSADDLPQGHRGNRIELFWSWDCRWGNRSCRSLRRCAHSQSEKVSVLAGALESPTPLGQLPQRIWLRVVILTGLALPAGSLCDSAPNTGEVPLIILPSGRDVLAGGGTTGHHAHHGKEHNNGE